MVTAELMVPLIVPERVRHAGGGEPVPDIILKTKSQVRSVLESKIGEEQVWVVIDPPTGLMV